MKITTIQPSPVLNTRAVTSLLHQLKKSVHQSISRRRDGSMPEVLIRRAMDEAAEAAEATGFPLLVFPLLAEEMVERVRQVIRDGDVTFSPGESLTLAHCA